MEAFTKLLQRKIASAGFVFHPRCSSLNLSHLIFADDMFILCGAEVQTFNLVTNVLSEFHKFSGLQTNLQKSAVFFAAVPDDRREILRSILNVPEASLPVKYLGVPLISTRLRYAD